MSRPSKVTRPATRDPGTVSCIRLRHRSSVDFPHPDGPMIAVTSPARKASDTSRTAREAPKYALTPYAASRGSPGAPGAGSVTAAGRAGAGGVSREEADDEDDREEDEGAGPGLGVPLVVRADGICEDLQGE